MRPRDPSGTASRSELGLRVGSGLVLAAVALLATWAGGPAFSALWLAAAVAISAEWMTITGVEPRVAAMTIGGTGLAVASVSYGTGAGALVPAGSLLVAAVALAALGRAGRIWGIGGLAYAALAALVPPIVRDWPGLGPLAVLWMFAVVWTTDVGAFFAGRSLGGPKLWSAVSPKKTWSGFVGGLVGAVAIGTAVAALGPVFGAEPPFGLLAVAVVSAAASLVSQVGDLMESALKRQFSVKDSGHLIPGHGGVMDRLDGFVAVALLVAIALFGSRVVER